MLIVIPIGGRVEQANLLHQPRLGVAEPLVFEPFIQRCAAGLDVLGFRVLEHTLQKRDAPDVIARCLGNGVGSPAIISIPIDEIDEATSARRARRYALSKETSTG
ncbi:MULTISPECIES: hypothetical protein [unclassified Bradyrhizobium]|uniref:hypothetical protein n=1 Tax=unclassified Bradyrhizobium TaxID=2631580 RepID=UPI00211E2019|nr:MULTISPECIES: hypothetical protein [unclassified Bradyrhizobium]